LFHGCKNKESIAGRGFSFVQQIFTFSPDISLKIKLLSAPKKWVELA